MRNLIIFVLFLMCAVSVLISYKLQSEVEELRKKQTEILMLLDGTKKDINKINKNNQKNNIEENVKEYIDKELSELKQSIIYLE